MFKNSNTLYADHDIESLALLNAFNIQDSSLTVSLMSKLLITKKLLIQR
jgi:hypothetical protein